MTGALFIHLYLDEDVDVLIADLLRSRGFAATTTLEAGNLNASDSEQFEYASTNDMTILTHNRLDYERLALERFNANRRHAGAIIAVRRLPYEIAGRLLKILNHVTADEMCDQLRYI